MPSTEQGRRAAEAPPAGLVMVGVRYYDHVGVLRPEERSEFSDRLYGEDTGSLASARVGRPRSVAVVSSAALSELIESVTVDAYGIDEQLTAFLTAFSEEVAVPCPATVLDLPVEVLASFPARRPAGWSWPERSAPQLSATGESRRCGPPRRTTAG